MSALSASGPHVDSATDLALERGVLGFIWLDEQLTVRRRRGVLTDWVHIGQRYDVALPMLVGFEAKLEALKVRPDEHAMLPNIGLVLADRTVPKCDMQFFWMPRAKEYLAILLHESAHSALQLELHHEIARGHLLQSREAELSKGLRRANEELQRANRDLESFAYIISHDLRAPLRAMRITADLLQADLGGILPAEAQDRLARIRMLSRRMGSMMSGLLEYARIGRKQEAIASVDTSKLVRDIIIGIGAPATLRIERHGQWPTLDTLAEPLDVVLRNLIENAVKHHDTKSGTIRLSVEDADAFLRFDVSDDGPGIDPSYHEAIFEPFRTVVEEASPESSGIGLALVKKTAELVGGRIEVASAPERERGTTFSLYWPKVIVGNA